MESSQRRKKERKKEKTFLELAKGFWRVKKLHCARQMGIFSKAHYDKIDTVQNYLVLGVTVEHFLQCEEFYM